jgi:deoxyribonuclease-1
LQNKSGNEMTLKWLVGFAVVVQLVSLSLQAAPDDFSEAKRVAQRIYSDENQTFYCGCPLRWQGGKGIPDLKACGYQVRKNGPRAQRIEWEHVVPAHQFGSPLGCWQQGGRDQCGREDAEFKRMEADLFNLKPAIGEVNGDRANFAFAELPDVRPQHGACPIRIDFKRKLAEPRKEIRGDIARIYFYMADKYALSLEKNQQQMLLKWHQADPVDARELQLHQRIAQQMGQPNYFVTGSREWYLGYMPTGYGLKTGPSVQTNAKNNTQHSAPKAMPAVNTSRPVEIASSNKVLGNKNSQLYHLAHCPGFTQVGEKNRRWFGSEQQALDAGFRRAKNCQ